MTGGEDDVIAAYDQLADTYEVDLETDAYNRHLAFPGTTSLLPDVDGERVLDAGCGTGLYAEWLLDEGADVVGVDASEAMLDHAAERVGDRAELQRADLREPLAFADDTFDGVVSALVLDYLEDLRRPIGEFARVLRPGGFLVFSVSHPLENYVDEDVESYFEVAELTKEWAVEVPYYHRPLSAIVDALLDARFGLDGLVEPQPTEAFREQRPERYAKESRQPVFLCLRGRRQ